MRKHQLFIALALLFSAFCTTIHAHAAGSALDDAPAKLRPNYFNSNYAKSQFDFKDNSGLKSDWGAGLTMGRTFYIKKDKPLGGMVRFGIDLTYIDINYQSYSYTDEFDDDAEKCTLHQGEVSMQLGPSVTVTPVKNFNIATYYRYTPGIGLIVEDDSEVYKAFSSYHAFGLSLSYKCIGFGIEKRWGEGKYKGLVASRLADDYGDAFPDGLPEEYEQGNARTKIKNSGMRVYLTFRF